MYFPEKEQAEKYVEELNKSGVLVTNIEIHAYWNIEFRTYAYKNSEAKIKHAEEMESKGWIINEGKQKVCLYGSFSDNPIWVMVNQFKRFKEVDQNEYTNN